MQSTRYGWHYLHVWGINNCLLLKDYSFVILLKFRDLCIDGRASVRKSSAQTLFSTLTTHGSILEAQTWKSVLWNVLFPLLERVKSLSGTASSDKITDSKSMGSGGSAIIIHHSRNTAQKQWFGTNSFQKYIIN